MFNLDKFIADIVAKRPVSMYKRQSRTNISVKE